MGEEAKRHAAIPAELFDELDKYLARTDISEDEKVEFIRKLCENVLPPEQTPRGPEIVLPRVYEWN